MNKRAFKFPNTLLITGFLWCASIGYGVLWAASESETSVSQSSECSSGSVWKEFKEGRDSCSSAGSYYSSSKEALFIAAADGDLATVKQLILPGSSYRRDTSGQTAMHHAVKGAQLEVMAYLNANKPEIKDEQDHSGFTPLHCAVTNRDTTEDQDREVVRLLIRMNANLNAVNNENQTPLYLATEAGKVKVARLLLDSNTEVDISIKGENEETMGRTALHEAAKCGYLDVAVQLVTRTQQLSNGNQVINAADDVGKTSLIEAVLYGHRTLVELLLSKDANVHAQTTGKWVHTTDNETLIAFETGLTALDVAKALGHAEVEKVLATDRAPTALPALHVNSVPKRRKRTVRTGCCGCKQQ